MSRVYAPRHCALQDQFDSRRLAKKAGLISAEEWMGRVLTGNEKA